MADPSGALTPERRQPNPKDTNAFARVGLIVGRFRDMDPADAFAAVATSDGGVALLTYGDLRGLLRAAFDAGDRLQRIAAWHSRETANGGLVGDYCVECGNRWPCETRRMADGEHEEISPGPPDDPTGGDTPAGCDRLSAELAVIEAAKALRKSLFGLMDDTTPEEDALAEAVDTLDDLTADNRKETPGA